MTIFDQAADNAAVGVMECCPEKPARRLVFLGVEPQQSEPVHCAVYGG